MQKIDNHVQIVCPDGLVHLNCCSECAKASVCNESIKKGWVTIISKLQEVRKCRQVLCEHTPFFILIFWIYEILQNSPGTSPTGSARGVGATSGGV